MKLKVAWICHFTSHDIQDKLGIKKEISEMAPWISLGIEEVKKRDDIELYVISPYPWIVKDTLYVDGNIHYYLYNSGIKFIGRHWPQVFRFDILTNFYSNKKKVGEFIKKINPDIIHLHGFENAYYSSTILQFIGNFPVLCTIQGFISMQEVPEKITIEFKKRLAIENQLMKSLSNFGVRTEHMKNAIRMINPDANFFWHEYFLNEVDSENEGTIEYKERKYDLIFFARICKEKGVEDLILALARLKEDFDDIKLAIVGTASVEYVNKLKQLAAENNCLENIAFLGFQKTQEDVFRILMNSKISVLPTYNDIIPGTIIESMLRKVPVVSYKTGGIPSINIDRENIILVDQGNIGELSIRIKELLKHETMRFELADLAYKYARKRWDNSKALNDIINIYHNILTTRTEK